MASGTTLAPATWEEATRVRDGWVAVSVAVPANADGSVVLCHGLGGDRRGPADLFVELAGSAQSAGRAAIRFDFRGAGESSGELAEVSVDSMIEDVSAVVARAREIDPGGPVTLAGHSIGGVIAALAAAQPGFPIDDAVCLAADLAPYDYGADAPVLFARDTDYFPVEFAVRRAALDLTSARFAVPFHFVTGTDERPGILATARALAGRGVPVHRLAGADHLFTDHRRELDEVVRSVFARGATT
jgi:pimeloyl-ACP methyl ester carboxylesterase